MLVRSDTSTVSANNSKNVASFVQKTQVMVTYFRTTRININRININPNDYYNPVIDYYNPVIDYYNPLLRFEPCLNQLGLMLISD